MITSAGSNISWECVLLLDCKDNVAIFGDMSGAVAGTILGGFAISTFQLLCASRAIIFAYPIYSSSMIQGLSKDTILESDGSIWHCQLKVRISDLDILGML